MGKKQSKGSELTQENIQFLLKNTHFSYEEIVDCHNSFMIDFPNGVVGKKKFIEVFKQFYPNGRADKFSGYLFRAFDTNKNGEIDFNEFLCALSITKGDLEEKLRLTFRTYDIDGNGVIDFKELTKVMHIIYDLIELDDSNSNKTPEDKAREIMKKLDKNSDNKLTESEFVNGCLEDKELQDLLSPFDF